MRSYVGGMARGITTGTSAPKVQHQLSPRLSVTTGTTTDTAGYFTASTALSEASKVRITDNLAVTPADFETFCITAPIDSRLPDGGGYQICGLADVVPAKFGQSQVLVRNQRTSAIGSSGTTSST